MEKEDKAFLHCYCEYVEPNRGFGESCSDLAFDIRDKRAARLLILLQQLDQDSGGLETLPNPELGEIISSAIEVCGFVDPTEARDVIADVLCAIAVHGAIPKTP
jgi:hypothetical protein